MEKHNLTVREIPPLRPGVSKATAWDAGTLPCYHTCMTKFMVPVLSNITRMFSHRINQWCNLYTKPVAPGVTRWWFERLLLLGLFTCWRYVGWPSKTNSWATPACVQPHHGGHMNLAAVRLWPRRMTLQTTWRTVSSGNVTPDVFLHLPSTVRVWGQALGGMVAAAPSLSQVV